ncbi:MAG: ATP-binding protein [Ignavibacteria bacterium]|nr:ATP-binding protein [Ignavibacteria bacterium]
MFIPRILEKTIINQLKHSKEGIIVYGPRQIGKTTLIRSIIDKLSLKTLQVNGDSTQHVDVFSSQDLSKLKSAVAGYDLLFIDEAQRIDRIGINIKLLRDHIPNLKIVVTGSSSLDLASSIKESLAGRVYNYTLYPISMLELGSTCNAHELQLMLEERLMFGAYPKIFSLEGAQIKQEYLQNVIDAYLYKDILELSGIKNSRKIRDLLKLLAFQIGNQVSLAEIGNQLDMSKDTVARYIDLLEQSFVVFRLSGFSRNLRKEVRKMDKIYFYDLGIRNAVINNFNYLKDRNDAGQLWENFLISERIKKHSYEKVYSNNYFWRTHTGAELDFVEEREGKLFGFEFKYNTRKPKAPKTWLKTYPNSSFNFVNLTNFLNFIT